MSNGGNELQGKVMFLLVFICSQGRGGVGGVCPVQVLFGGGDTLID